MLSKIKQIMPKSFFSTMVHGAAYTTLILNSLFLHKVYEAVAPATVLAWVFFISVPFLLFFLNLILFSWLSLITFARPLLFISIVLSSVLLYASTYYGVIFDNSMMRNIMETDTGEALSYLNWSIVVYVSVLGIAPALWLTIATVKESWITRLKAFVKINVVSTVCAVLIALILYQSYASVGRRNKELASYIVPFSFVVAGYKHVRDTYFYPPLPFQLLDKKPGLMSKNTKTVTVVVVGETARASNFSLGGYQTDTNRYTKNDNIKFFSNVTACGTATAISVPCMFSRLDREGYSSRQAESQENVLDIIHRAGATVLWIDNNSSCKGVCKRVGSLQLSPEKSNALCDGKYCFDEVLIEPLITAINASKSMNTVIVLHMIGSHGPTYFRRYPKEFRLFTPDCQRSDIHNCSEQQLTNTYDNTIAYTDYVLHRIISVLTTVDADTLNMLYVSDHGESLGEHGLYLHGFPYQLAPTEQTHIPMIYWSNQLISNSYDQCVAAQLDRPLSHDYFYDILIGLTAVTTSTYKVQNDVLASCRPSLLALTGKA